MEAIKNGLCKNLTPAQLWSGARFFLLLNLSLIICAAALNFYCAPTTSYLAAPQVFPLCWLPAFRR